MSLQRWFLAFLLADFTVFTAWVAVDAGWAGFVAVLESSPWGIQIAIDLVIALSLVLAWIVRDARARGVSPVPWVALTLLTGSIGPLLYLTLRPSPRKLAVGAAATQEA